MQIPIYQVDAFTNERFSGNPAAVCPLDSWLEDSVLQNIALENNLSETAFFVKNEKGYHIRWFTPAVEVKLCGHATLATSFVIFNYFEPNSNKIHFDSLSGELIVTKENDLLTLDFPIKEITKTEIPKLAVEAFGKMPLEAYNSDDLLLVFDDEDFVKKVKPNFEILKKLTGFRGVCITSKGKDFDFVSRFFAPIFGINEDPVTGSAHCMLIPFWAEKLGKNDLRAKQVSARGGELICKLDGKRVKISGNAVLYLEGKIKV
ncbi:MAG: PhzF family phenazine biosynthesis protein [Calditrichaeota bacterium]|nr:MAG: PhzF family phenazine biosynthesis protein [Calditrichota bacterium]